MIKNKYVVAIILALVVAIVAPFIASSNPDGLEATAEHVGAEGGHGADTPFADYSINGMGKTGEVLSLVVGTLVVLAVGYGSTLAVKRMQ